MVELYKEGITPHIQVHDELDISVSDNADKIKEIMEHAVSLEVPNKVDYESGPNWGNIKQEETMNRTIENLKEKIEHNWLMHREYIIGGVVGFVLGAIIF